MFNYQNLQYLNLSNNEIAKISGFAFNSSTFLQDLDLSKNHLKQLSRKSLQGLSLLKLIRLSGNLLVTVEFGIFDNMQIKLILADISQVCCILYDPKVPCTIKVMPNCKQLLPLKLFQIFGMMTGILSSVIYSLPIFFCIYVSFSEHNKAKTSRIFDILTSVLHFSDILLVLHVFTLSVKDSLEDDTFINRSFSWKQSYFCYLLSMISFFSVVYSPLIIFLIGLFRFLKIIYPMKIFTSYNTVKMFLFFLCNNYCIYVSITFT